MPSLDEPDFCTHQWKRRPDLQRFDGQYEAVCIKCWSRGLAPVTTSVWTADDYYEHMGEVERRFGAQMDLDLAEIVHDAADKYFG
jgi:hypothetical protein